MIAKISGLKPSATIKNSLVSPVDTSLKCSGSGIDCNDSFTPQEPKANSGLSISLKALFGALIFTTGYCIFTSLKSNASKLK